MAVDYVQLGDGTGRFGSALGPFPTGARYAARTFVTDLDGDGRADVTTTNSSSADNAISVLRGSPSGALTAVSGSPFRSFGGTPSATQAPARFGGDALPDLIITESYTQLAVLNGDGTGHFTTAAGSPLPLPGVAGATNGFYPVTGDFDDNGVEDVAYVVYYGSNTVNVHVLLGRAAVVSDRASVPFDTVTPGTASAAQTVHLTDRASFGVPFGLASLSGPDAGQFQITSDRCGATTLAAGAGCDVQVRAVATTPGAKSAALEIPQDGDVVRVPLSATVPGPVASLPPPTTPVPATPTTPKPKPATAAGAKLACTTRSHRTSCTITLPTAITATLTIRVTRKGKTVTRTTAKLKRRRTVAVRLRKRLAKGSYTVRVTRGKTQVAKVTLKVG